MILWIIIGGSCLTATYTAVGAVDFIGEIVSALPVSRYVILAGIQITLIFLGSILYKSIKSFLVDSEIAITIFAF